MFADPEALLRSTKGTLKELPLPLLFHALCATRRTAGLELKRQAYEKLIIFDSGTAIACTSNLAHESMGRFLVEKRVLTEDQHHQALAESARRGVPFEDVLLEQRLIDAATLDKHRLANLAQKILDAFSWTDASYRLRGDVNVDPCAPRMNAAQMLATALCTVVPAEVIASHFPFRGAERFATAHAPPMSWDELKLTPKESRLAEAVKKRATLAELARASELDEDAVRRRLFAWALLGLINLSEKVPAMPATPASQPSAAPNRRSPYRALALLAVGLILIGGAVWAVASLHSKDREAREDDPQMVIEIERRTPPSGTPIAKSQVLELSPAPAGSSAQPGRPRGLMLSASGIAFDPPKPSASKGHKLSLDATRLLTSGQASHARTVFENLAKQQPKDASAHYGAALAAFVEGKDDVARGHCAKALELAPESASAHLLAGYLAQLEGKGPEAIKHYQAFLKDGDETPRAGDVRTLVERLAVR